MKGEPLNCKYLVSLFLSMVSFYSFSKEDSSIEPLQALFDAIENKDKNGVKRLLAEIDCNQSIQGRTPLMCAMQEGIPKVVGLLLANNADVNAQDNKGNTALMIGLRLEDSSYDHMRSVERLLQAKPNMNIKNNEGFTSLLIAAQGGPFNMERFVTGGADVKICDNNGWTAIMHVICSDGFKETDQWFVPLVNELIKAGVDIHAYNNEGMNALMLATKHQDEVIELLVKFCGASVNAKNKEGVTALMVAAQYKPQSIALLLKLGADINAKNNKGETALTIAKNHNIGALQPLLAASDNPSSIEFFIKENIDINAQDSEGMNQLMSAVRWNSSAVKNLLQAGADVNAKNRANETALIIAARYNAEAIPLLIAHGADIEYEVHDCDYRNNALTTAVRYNTESVKQLLAAGANIKVCGTYHTNRHLLSDDLLGLASAFNSDALEPLLQVFTKVNANDEFGTHALRVAIKYKPEFITPLLKAGVDVNAKKDKGLSYASNELDSFLTPLMIAAERGTAEVIKILVEAGAHLEVKDDNGCTALFHAINEGKNENASKLIALGANVNHQNDEGCTPIMNALDSYRDSDELIRLILAGAPNINLQNKHGQTALTIAQNSNKQQYVTLLQDFATKNHTQAI